MQNLFEGKKRPNHSDKGRQVRALKGFWNRESPSLKRSVAGGRGIGKRLR